MNRNVGILLLAAGLVLLVFGGGGFSLSTTGAVTQGPSNLALGVAGLVLLFIGAVAYGQFGRRR